MATSERMRERIEAFARELCEESGEVDASMGVCWLDAVENQAIEISDAVTAELIKRQSAHQVSTTGESTCQKCGKRGQYKGTRERELLTRRGPVTITEPEYYCPCCRKAFFPSDQRDRR